MMKSAPIFGWGPFLIANFDSVRYNVRMNTFMTATQGRKNFYAMLKIIQKPDTAIIITHEGEPKGVFLSFDEFEGWLETMEIMADPDPTLKRDLLRGIREMKSGKRVNGVSLENLRKRLKF